jgi:hypothetical protein
MVETGTVVTNTVFARTVAAMFNPSATLDAQFDTLAKYIPAVSTATGKRHVGSDQLENNNLNGADYRNGWGRPASEEMQPWLHSDIKDMAYLFINGLYGEMVVNGGLR